MTLANSCVICCLLGLVVSVMNYVMLRLIIQCFEAQSVVFVWQQLVMGVVTSVVLPDQRAL